MRRWRRRRSARAEFDALFDAHFLGLSPGLRGVRRAERRAAARRRRIARRPGADLRSDDANEAGQASDRAPSRFRRAASAPASEDETLRRFARALPARMPRRRGYRRVRARRGAERRCAAHVSRSHAPCRRDHHAAPPQRRLRQRRVLLLIDVSGSMKERTEAHLLSRTRWCAPPTRSKCSPSARGSPASPGRCGCKQPRTGARRRFAARRRLGRRHAHRRRAQRLSRACRVSLRCRAAQRWWCCRTGSSAAIRPPWRDAVARLSRARLAPCG